MKFLNLRVIEAVDAVAKLLRRAVIAVFFRHI